MLLLYLFLIQLGSIEPLKSTRKNDYLKTLIDIKLNKIEHYIRQTRQIVNKERPSVTTSPLFKPKLTEEPAQDEEYGEIERDEYYDYYNDELPETFDKIPDQRMTTSSPNWATKNSSALSKVNLKILFDFVELILRPTGLNENTVECANKLKQHNSANEETSDFSASEDSFSEESNLDITEEKKNNTAITTSVTRTATSNTKNESIVWYMRENVCYSKIAYQKESKNHADYWFINNCKSKFDSEFCVTNVQAGYKNFELHSTLFCCPNYQLNLTTESCVLLDKDKVDLFAELKESFFNLNRTLYKFFEQNDISTSDSLIKDFLTDISKIYEDLIRDTVNTNANSTKYTIYLWDNNKFIEFIKSVLAYNDFTLNQKLEKILNTIRNHITHLHHPTQSIVSNDLELETLAKKKLRFSTIILENKSIEFVNCKEIMIKNRYYKPVQDGSGNDHYNYRLLIHKLQTGSIITPLTKTVYQILNEKILKPTLVKNNFKIYQKIFAQSQDKLSSELNKQHKTSAITLFVPTDEAFKTSLRSEQIESLIADKVCGYKFLMHNIIFEEVCPTQLIKYGAEHSSTSQRANFIAVNENQNNMLYFNGQIVNLSKSSINTAANGMIYRLSSLNLNGMVDFLYDIVIGFKKKFPSNFVNALNPNWMDIIKSENNNSTLFLPLEEKSSLSEPKNNEHQANGKDFNNASSIVSNTSILHQIDRVNILDYLIKPRFTFYDFNDGMVITSVSNKKYLINVYQLENPLDFMNFVPARNFQRKTINCQQLEMPDLNACNAQLVVFKSENNQIPLLHIQPVLDFIAYYSDLSVISSLIEVCGKDCKSIFNSLTEPGDAINSANRRKGYTLILPSNSYFNKQSTNFAKYSKNLSFLKKQLQSNIFYGTYCHVNMRSNILVENLLNKKIQAKKIFARITEGNVYLSETGIIIHKSDVL